MNGIDISDFERRAVSGDWHAAVTVLSRASLKPEVLEQLMVPEAHLEVRIALAARQDVTPEQLAWCANCDSAFMLNRIVSHPKTPQSTLKDIRGRSADRDGEIWVMLHSYASRTLDRILKESGGLHGG